MKYKIEVDFVACLSKITYSPNTLDKSFFEHPGNPIDACNYRIKQILEKEEREIKKSNLLGARVYNSEGDKLLDVDYRKDKENLTLSTKIEEFWIKI